ncbi:hypothetical protein [Tautonia marina]|uniref:hypothetical protein n=1 Tax=Tautonia marina TaxID=2653855 RepID=UPI001376390E|nr:hypothetical protein [Tautonia marina]
MDAKVAPQRGRLSNDFYAQRVELDTTEREEEAFRRLTALTKAVRITPTENLRVKLDK